MTDDMNTEYSPRTDMSEWDVWGDSIEIKLSKQGQMIMGLGVGLGVVLLLNLAQGKVVINLVKGHKMVIDAINIMAARTNTVDSSVSYTEPSGHIDESTIEPVEEEQLKDLEQGLNGYKDTPTFGEEL